MTTQSLTIANVFGERLREERERIGLNQTQLAEVAGIKRMAQGQYENEVRSPTVKYLSAISGAGVDLHYLLFGKRPRPSPDDQRRLEKNVFEMVEQFARQQPDGQLGAEGRYAIFEFLRTHMENTTGDNSLPPSGLAELIAGFNRV